MIRKGARVRYIGEEYKDLAYGKIFRVMHKWYDSAILMFPQVCCGGRVHAVERTIPLSDLEEVK